MVPLQVADALEMPFADSSYDLAWSLESGEHMPDKQVACAGPEASPHRVAQTRI